MITNNKGEKQMKFGEYVNKKGKVINESSLSRLWRHMQEHDSGTITAYRHKEYDKNDKDKVVKTYIRKENKARNKLLYAKLSQKYDVTKVKGSYIENYGSSKAHEVGEMVWFVVDKNDTENLEKDLRKLGQQFNQDSILYIPKGGTKGILIGTKNDEYSDYYAYPDFGQKKKLPNAVWGKEGEFMTKMHGRPFYFKEEVIHMPRPKGFFTNWGLSLLAKENNLENI
jgi:hypothetical protein